MTEQDKEASAISSVVNALASLDKHPARVLEYAIKRFAPSIAAPSRPTIRLAEDLQPKHALRNKKMLPISP